MVKINLGCNIWKLPGFVNIDLDPNVHPDVVGDVCKLDELGYDDDSVDEIYAGHMLEHVTDEDEALYEWYRVLKPGGTITITVPDVEKGLIEMVSGRIDNHWFQQIIFGSAVTHEQNHHRAYTEATLRAAVTKYFKDARIITDCPYLVGRVAWQTIITGTKC